MFLVRNHQGLRCALKRMYVNNEHDLQLCKLEIQVMVRLSLKQNALSFFCEVSIINFVVLRLVVHVISC